MAVHVVMLGIVYLSILCAFARWISTPGWLNDGDLAFPLSAQALWKEHYPAWNPSGFPTMAATPHLFVTALLSAVAHALSWDGQTYEKVTVLVIVLMAGTAAYAGGVLLLETFSPSSLPRLSWGDLSVCVVFAVFYVLNPWSLGRVGHLYVLMGFSVAPLVAALAVRALVTRSLRPAIAGAILHSVVGSSSPHSAIFVGMVVSAAVAFHAVLGFDARPIRLRLRASATTLVAFGMTYVLGSAFIWFFVLAQTLAGNPIPLGLVVAQDLENLTRNQTLLNTLRLVGNWYWSDALQPQPPAPIGWSMVSLAPFVVVVAGAIMPHRLRRLCLFFLLLAAVCALLLVVATSPALRESFQVAVDQLPLGWLVREPDKAAGIIALAYTLGGTVAVSSIVRHLNRPGATGWHRFDQRPLAVGTAITLVLFVIPAVSGVLWNPGTAVLPRQLPPEYLDVFRQFGAPRATDFSPRALALGSGQPRVWSGQRTVELFLPRSLPIRSFSTATVLGATYAQHVKDILGDGRDPAPLLRASGTSLVIVESDHAEGRRLRGYLEALRYSFLGGGPSVAVFGVPEARRGLSSSPDSFTSHPVVEAAASIQLVTGLPDVTGTEDRIPAVTVDLAPLPPAQIHELASLQKEGGNVAQDLALLDASRGQIVSLTTTVLNDDPRAGWARGRAAQTVYSRWHDTLALLGLSNWQFDYGVGLLFTFASGNTVIRAPITLVERTPSGDQRVWARVLASPKGGALAIRLSPRAASPSLGHSSAGLTPAVSSLGLGEESALFEPILTSDIRTGFVWRNLGTLDLRPGRAYEAEIENLYGFNAVNALVIVPIHPTDPFPAPGASTDRSPPVVKWSHPSPTRYVVSVQDVSQPFFLILHEHFDPGWLAQVGQTTIHPVLTNGISNGYPISELGTYSIVIDYAPQRWYDAGIIVSLTSGSLAMVYVAGWRPRRFRIHRSASADRRATLNGKSSTYHA